MKILIRKRHRNAGHGQSEQDGNRGHRGPMRLGPREAAATDPPASVKQKKDGGELPEQHRPSQRQVRQAHKPGDELVEDGGLKLQPEKICVMRKQGWVQISLDRREVKRVVFKARMVAHYQERERGEPRQPAQMRNREIATARRT